MGTKTQAYTPTKRGFVKQEPGFVKQEPGFVKQEPGFGKQEPGFMSRDNSLKREVLNLKACVQGMRKKFDEFVEQQIIAFEDIESRTDMIILAIEGTPSGLDSSVSILNIQMLYLLSHFSQSHEMLSEYFKNMYLSEKANDSGILVRKAVIGTNSVWTTKKQDFQSQSMRNW